MATVTKAAPAVTWGRPAGITRGTPLGIAQLDATAWVPGSFTYAPPAGTILSAGQGQSLSVLFTPTDLANYTTASAAVTIDVAPMPSQPLTLSSTELSVSSSSVHLGQPLTITVAIGVAPGSGTPDGSITFVIDGVLEASVPVSLSGGAAVAVFSSASLAIGTHNVIATYSGDAHFAPSAGNRRRAGYAGRQ